MILTTYTELVQLENSIRSKTAVYVCSFFTRNQLCLIVNRSKPAMMPIFNPSIPDVEWHLLDRKIVINDAVPEGTLEVREGAELLTKLILEARMMRATDPLRESLKSANPSKPD